MRKRDKGTFSEFLDNVLIPIFWIFMGLVFIWFHVAHLFN